MGDSAATILAFYVEAFSRYCDREAGEEATLEDELYRQFGVILDMSYHCPLLAIAVCDEVLKRGYPSASSDMICTQTLVHAISSIPTEAERELALDMFRSSTGLRWASEHLWEKGLSEQGRELLQRVRQLP